MVVLENLVQQFRSYIAPPSNTSRIKWGNCHFFCPFPINWIFDTASLFLIFWTNQLSYKNGIAFRSSLLGISIKQKNFSFKMYINEFWMSGNKFFYWYPQHISFHITCIVVRSVTMVKKTLVDEFSSFFEWTYLYKLNFINHWISFVRVKTISYYK